MKTLVFDRLVSMFVILFNLVDVTRMARIIYFSQGVLAQRQQRFPCKRRRCANSTPHRAPLSRATRSSSRRVHVAPHDRGFLSDCSLCVS